MMMMVECVAAAEEDEGEEMKWAHSPSLRLLRQTTVLRAPSVCHDNG